MRVIHRMVGDGTSLACGAALGGETLAFRFAAFMDAFIGRHEAMRPCVKCWESSPYTWVARADRGGSYLVPDADMEHGTCAAVAVLHDCGAWTLPLVAWHDGQPRPHGIAEQGVGGWRKLSAALVRFGIHGVKIPPPRAMLKVVP